MLSDYKEYVSSKDNRTSVRRIVNQSNISNVGSKLEIFKSLMRRNRVNSSTSMDSTSLDEMEFELEKITIENTETFEYYISEDLMQNLSLESEEILSKMLDKYSIANNLEILKDTHIGVDKVTFVLDIKKK